MENNEELNAKRYDLEDRTRKFALRCRALAYCFPQDILTSQDVKQLIKSSGSVAANYIESRESLSRKDCVYRLKICKKEAKESHLWLTLLIAHPRSPDSEEVQRLVKESMELTLIFGSIVSKLSTK